MTSGDDKRALERFVAGLEVEEDALAAAVTARAVDRTIVVEALLTALSSPEAAVRRRAALRVARMADIVPRIVAELTRIAAADPDERAREAGAAALRAHRLREPGAADEPGAAPARARSATSLGGRLRAVLWLQPLIFRAEELTVHLRPRVETDAPDMSGRLTADDEGRILMILARLPATFAGSRPSVRARRDAGSTAYSEIGAATAPVSVDGAVTILIDPDLGSLDEVEGVFEHDIELVVRDD